MRLPFHNASVTVVYRERKSQQRYLAECLMRGRDHPARSGAAVLRKDASGEGGRLAIMTSTVDNRV